MSAPAAVGSFVSVCVLCPGCNQHLYTLEGDRADGLTWARCLRAGCEHRNWLYSIRIRNGEIVGCEPWDQKKGESIWRKGTYSI